MASVLARPGAAEVTRPSRPRPGGVRPWQVWLAVTFAVGAFTLLFRLGESRSLGSHEGYAIVPAREMLQSGDYVVPRFGDLPRLQKPPLIYWTILASAKLTGGLDVVAARLPVAMAGLLLAGLMAWWARRWYGGTAAVGAAAAQFTSLWVLQYARRAEADLILVLLVAAAMLLVVESGQDERRRVSFWRWVGVWSCAAVSWLGKFHFGPVMIFAPAVIWLILERRSLRGLFNPVGLLLFAAAAGIWPALVMRRLPDAWSIWQAETIGRAVGELGREPIWFYLPHLVTWPLPWTFLAYFAWPASWRAAFGHVLPRESRLWRGAAGDLFARGERPWAALTAGRSLSASARMVQIWSSVSRFRQRLASGGDPRERFLWVWLGVSLAVVSASANKHPHYILPALPAFSLWTGRRFAELAAQVRQGRRLLSRQGAVMMTVAAVVGVVVPVALRGRLPQEIPLAAILVVVGPAVFGLAAMAWLLVWRKNTAAGGVLVASWVITFGMASAWLIPVQDHRAGAYRFVEQVRRRLGPAIEIGVYRMNQDAVVWFLGEPVYRMETRLEVADRLRREGSLRLLTSAKRLNDLARLGNVRVIERFRNTAGRAPVSNDLYRKMVVVELSPRVFKTAAGTDQASVR